MAYCGIMRIEKRKRAAVYGLQIEANRTVEDHEHGRDFDRSDIDWTLTNQNFHLIYTENWNKEITRQLHEAGIREITHGKNQSVVMLDALYTASPEWFERNQEEKIRREYFEDCLNFHIDQYCGGDRSRVLNAVVHVDETSWHMQVASVPIILDEDKYKLSAKIIMGNRTDYRRRQDLFYDTVTAKYGLERGETVEYEEQTIRHNGIDKLVLSRAEDARLHVAKREWQIAEQNEQLHDLEMQIMTQNERIANNENIIINQNQEIKNKQDMINNQPHILTPNEIRTLSAIEKQPNVLTGNISLSQEEYRSLLATKIETDNIRNLKKEVIQEKHNLKTAQKRLEYEREDIVAEAREEGLRLGMGDQKQMRYKAACFDEFMRLAKSDTGLSYSLKRAITDKIKLYPQLVDALSKVYDWAHEMKKQLTVSIKW